MSIEGRPAQLPEWEFLPLATYPGEFNMSLDRQLLEELQSGKRTRPIVRFYEWKKPTISLGKNQKIHEVVRREEVTRLGYEIVYRPTGGRALLHKEDICYAIIADRRMHPFFHSLTSTYRAIGGAISAMLRSLGIAGVDVPAEGNDFRRSLNPCFALLSPFEVTVFGKKICGSAQFRSGDFFLQHGSIRIRDNWNEDDLNTIWPVGYFLEGEKVTCIDRERDCLTDVGEVALRFSAALEGTFGIRLVDHKSDAH